MDNLPATPIRRIARILCPLFAIVALWASALVPGQASAQIVRDGTPGQIAGAIDPVSGVYTIHGDDGIKNNDETFVLHSMDEFNIGAGETALFTDNTPALSSVQDVMVRVTGRNNDSVLLGRLESAYNDADIFILNPNGVFLGPDFTLDLDGSFVVSTADLFELYDTSQNLEVSIETAPNTLEEISPDFSISVDNQIQLGFLGTGPRPGSADIVVDGLNAVPSFDNDPDATIAFVGRNISLADDDGAQPITTTGRSLLAIAIGNREGFVTQVVPDSPIGEEAPSVTDLALDPILPEGFIISNADIDTGADGVEFSGDLVFWGGTVQMTTGSITTASFDSSTLESGDVTLFGTNVDIAVDIDTTSEFGQGGDVFISGFQTLGFTGGPRTIDTGGTTGQFSGDVLLNAGSSLVADELTIRVTDPLRGNLWSSVALTAANLSFVDGVIEAGTSNAFGGTGVSFSGANVDLRGATIDVSNDGGLDQSAVGIFGINSLDMRGTRIDASGTSGAQGGVILVQHGSTLQLDDPVNFDVSGDPQAGSVVVEPFNPGGSGGSGGSSDPLDLASLSETEIAPILDPIVQNAVAESPSVAGSSDDVLLDTSAFGSVVDFGDALAAASSASQRAGRNEEALEEAQDEDVLTLVAASEAEAQRKSESEANGSVSIFTNAGERAPLVPRTCSALAAGERDSKLLARTNQRLPASPEDWLIAYDASGDRLLAAAQSPELAPVAAIAEGDEERGGSPRDARAQRDLTEAALAIRAGRYEQAAERFASAVDALLAAQDQRGASEAMLAYAQLQLQEGHFAAARRELERALEIAQDLGDEAHLAAVRASLGNALIATGELGLAEEQLTRGLAVVSKSTQSASEAPSSAVLNNLGNRHAAQNDHASARKAFERSAALARERGLPADEARALLGAARVAVESGDTRGALRHLERARPLVLALEDPAERAPLSIHMGRTHGSIATSSPRYRADSLRRGYEAFDDARRSAEEAGDLRGVALANLNLGALYDDEQHRREALYLTRLARRAAEGLGAPEILYRTHWQEGKILWGQHQVDASLAALRRAVAILEETKPIPSDGYGSSDANFRRLVGGVYRDTVDRLLRAASLETKPERAERLVVEARDVIERFKAAELRDYFEDECIASAGGVGRGMDALGEGAAVVYTVTLPDRLELLVGLPSGIERFTVPVAASRLHRSIDLFRRTVQNPLSRAYRRSGQQLHDWIVRPMADHLAANDVTTLVFIADGRLRTVPFAALYDGEQHLGERYALASALSLRLLVPDGVMPDSGRAVLAGVSDSVQGFSPLEAVEQEIAEIQQRFGGDVLLNEAFTLESVRNAVSTERPGVVHLATHAVFSGNPKTSFLLTHSGRVGLSDLSDVVGMTRADGAPLDLLVLSACETAVGNDRAGLGFTGSAIRAGARSALGSLWPISDAAAGELMIDFYRGLEDEGRTKADALRQAQAALRASGRFDHPYYWAPFTLVNDWL